MKRLATLFLSVSLLSFAATIAPKTVDKMKISIDVPSDVEVMDTSADAPNVSMFNNDFKVGVSTVTPVYAETFAKAKEEAEKDPGCTFTSWVKNEETPDGWHIHYKCKGMSGDERQKVQIRKKIGETSYECGEMVDTDAAAEATTKACQTLKAAG